MVTAGVRRSPLGRKSLPQCVARVGDQTAELSEAESVTGNAGNACRGERQASGPSRASSCATWNRTSKAFQAKRIFYPWRYALTMTLLFIAFS